MHALCVRPILIEPDSQTKKKQNPFAAKFRLLKEPDLAFFRVDKIQDQLSVLPPPRKSGKIQDVAALDFLSQTIQTLVTPHTPTHTRIGYSRCVL